MLGGQLRDRARLVKRTKEAARIEGGYSKMESFGPWFRCFYDVGDEPESRSDGGIRRRESGAQLVCGRRALDGTLIEVEASDAVEIDSARHGQLRMEVMGSPERLTKRRTTIGWLVSVGKADRSAPG